MGNAEYMGIKKGDWQHKKVQSQSGRGG